MGYYKILTTHMVISWQEHHGVIVAPRPGPVFFPKRLGPHGERSQPWESFIDFVPSLELDFWTHGFSCSIFDFWRDDPKANQALLQSDSGGLLVCDSANHRVQVACASLCNWASPLHWSAGWNCSHQSLQPDKRTGRYWNHAWTVFWFWIGCEGRSLWNQAQITPNKSCRYPLVI